ncbi:MAG TPA: ectoine/hydroxyectoine ABC transporter permease subunit EhuC [Sandaracinaceae bacterium LLY-WYZ-13_1]|nr:ectoine/hydroxyectoine ABC transporter permease subunit EhuC [Sandaracinaceae bacterium LLY-WYZ-13_1]
MGEAPILIAKGLGVTLVLTAGGAVLAALLALLAGLASLSRDPILRGVARVYVEVFRGTSVLVQLFWLYYALPILFGVDLPALLAGILALGANVGAYGAEVVRGAIEDVPEGQHEAAVALGLTDAQRYRHVIVPQAVLAMLPPAGNLVIELLKASALASMITVADLTFAADRIRAHTLETTLAYGGVLLIYFVVAQALVFGVRRLERRLAARRGLGEAIR